MKALVIEDSRAVIGDVHFCLKMRWPDVSIVSTGKGQDGIEMVELEMPDLVIVDSNLPDIDITDLITRIREFCDVPLIVLSQQQNELDTVRCLDAGADACVNTPFIPMELLTKVKALLRRSRGFGYNFKEEQPIVIGHKLTINAGTREVMLEDKRIKLTLTEYRILLELVKNRGRVVSHEALLGRVLGSEYAEETGIVTRYVYRLRHKLEVPSGKPLIYSKDALVTDSPSLTGPDLAFSCSRLPTPPLSSNWGSCPTTSPSQ